MSKSLTDDSAQNLHFPVTGHQWALYTSTESDKKEKREEKERERREQASLSFCQGPTPLIIVPTSVLSKYCGGLKCHVARPPFCLPHVISEAFPTLSGLASPTDLPPFPTACGSYSLKRCSLVCLPFLHHQQVSGSVHFHFSFRKGAVNACPLSSLLKQLATSLRCVLGGRSGGFIYRLPLFSSKMWSFHSFVTFSRLQAFLLSPWLLSSKDARHFCSFQMVGERL